MKSVLQTIRKSDNQIVSELDVSGFSKARVEHHMKVYALRISESYYLKYVEDKIEHNGL